MKQQLIYLLACFGGIAMLVWSADKFVQGAAAIAKHFGMSALMIGLTIVAIGTSAPEILVSSTAAIDGKQGLAIGNAMGSNIANIGLVLGITALIINLPVAGDIKRLELPALLITTIVTGLLLIDEHLGLVDGLILIGGLIIITLLLIRKSQKSSDNSDLVQEAEELSDLPLSRAISWFIFALLILLVSSKLLVWAASGIAASFGVSEVIIGLTIVAIGTSLPELAASVAGAMKGHHDIAIGNVIGSNILNLMAVLSLPGLINPTDIDPSVLYRDYMVMLGLTLLMAFNASKSIFFGKSDQITRTDGAIMLICYLAYLGWLIRLSL